MSIGLRHGRRGRVVGVAVVVYAAVASWTQPLTPAAAVAVAVPGLVVLMAAAVWPSRTVAAAEAGRVRRSAVAWGALACVAAGWELAAWLRQPAYNVASPDHPTVSLLLDPVTESSVPRFVVWCAWLYVGYRLVRR